MLAGVAVAEGSSRVLEAIELRDASGVVTLPDVTSEERNWLLRHASICLYPTSNEGFGLVPFEAARFGTPTVFTRVGPLAEVLDGVPVVSELGPRGAGRLLPSGCSTTRSWPKSRWLPP